MVMLPPPVWITMVATALTSIKIIEIHRIIAVFLVLLLDIETTSFSYSKHTSDESSFPAPPQHKKTRPSFRQSRFSITHAHIKLSYCTKTVFNIPDARVTVK